MAQLTTVAQLMARISNQYTKMDSSQFNQSATRVGPISGAGLGSIIHRATWFRDIPTLETGVTAYIPTETYFQTTTTNNPGILIAEMINLGSLDISTNTFTDGSAMPTRTVFNTSTPLSGPVLVEAETALNATPGTLVLTYTDQSGNTGHVTPSTTLVASTTQDAGSFITLATGDSGVRDITAAVRSAGTTPTGTLRFWGMVPIVMSVGGNASTTNGTTMDLINLGIIRRLPTGAKIGMFVASGTATAATFGWIHYVGDS